MATSQQQWRHGSQLLLLAAALALVLLIAAGSADAKCPAHYADCDGNSYNGCEINIYTDPYNCGKCGYKCKLSSDYKYGEVICSGGKCVSRCKSGWHYNKAGKYCYQY